MKFHDPCFNKVSHFVVLLLSDLIYTRENSEVAVAWIPNLNIRKTMALFGVSFLKQLMAYKAISPYGGVCQNKF